MAEDVNRRDFVRTAVGAGVAASVLNVVRPAGARVIGANDRINLGIIGMGGRGNFLLDTYMAIKKATSKVEIVAVCDVYEKRKRLAAEKSGAKGTLDWREIINNKDIDGVVIATPDHWHAPMAIAAMNAGKDVFLEKPMTRTVEEAKQVYETSVKTKRILEIGSQTTSSDQWWKAQKVLADGMIGKMIMSQGSYHRNWNGKQQPPGEWNWTIETEAGPDSKGDNYIDWKGWLGDAPQRSWSDGGPDRFFRFRKYWDYSGGIATDLFYHVMAPLNLCWGKGEFPYRVAGTGGIYVFKDEREVPDTFMLVADYPSGHSVVLSSSMANSRHIPGTIRGHEGTIVMVEHGQFEGRTDFITVTPENFKAAEFEQKWVASKPEGWTWDAAKRELRIPVVPNRRPGQASLPDGRESRASHWDNFLDCMRSRETPVLHGELAFRAMVPIAMSVESYRLGQTLFFDKDKQKVLTKAPVAPPKLKQL